MEMHFDKNGIYFEGSNSELLDMVDLMNDRSNAKDNADKFMKSLKAGVNAAFNFNDSEDDKHGKDE